MRAALLARLRNVFAAIVVVTAASSAHAYSVEAGNLLVRPVVGAGVNMLRLDVATRATPAAGMIVGIDIDYSFDGPLSLALAVRPTLSPGFIDGELGVGLKYRVTQLEAPFIPYGAALVTGSVGGPLGYGDVHVSAGLRVAGGVDYFVMNNLAVGLEIGVEGSGLFVPLPAYEMTTSVLAGLTWKI
jgi:hypothetical protein